MKPLIGTTNHEFLLSPRCERNIASDIVLMNKSEQSRVLGIQFPVLQYSLAITAAEAALARDPDASSNPTALIRTLPFFFSLRTGFSIIATQPLFSPSVLGAILPEL